MSAGSKAAMARGDSFNPKLFLGLSPSNNATTSGRTFFPVPLPGGVPAGRVGHASLLRSEFRLAVAVLIAGICFAQLQPLVRLGLRGGVAGKLVRIEGGTVIDEDAVRTARETVSHSADTPNWTNAPGFERDVHVRSRDLSIRTEQS